MKNAIFRFRTVLANFLDWLSTLNTAQLTSIPALIVIGVMIILGNVNMSRIANMLLVSSIFSAGSVISLVIIFRKEFPFFQTIKGKPAIILGSIGFLMSCPISIAILVRLAMDLFQR